MKRDEIISLLKSREADLRDIGVTRAALFGSVARGEEGPDSDIDIDIMIELAKDPKMDLFRYVGIVQFIEELFDDRVDVADRSNLRNLVRPTAERDAIDLFREDIVRRSPAALKQFGFARAA